MVVTFIGHRDIRFGDDLPLRLKELVLTLIDDRGADTFLFGSRSDFDELCLEVVTELQRQRRGAISGFAGGGRRREAAF